MIFFPLIEHYFLKIDLEMALFTVQAKFNFLKMKVKLVF